MSLDTEYLTSQELTRLRLLLNNQWLMLKPYLRHIPGCPSTESKCACGFNETYKTWKTIVLSEGYKS